MGKELNYVSPIIRIVRAVVEKGFAASVPKGAKTEVLHVGRNNAGAGWDME